MVTELESKGGKRVRVEENPASAVTQGCTRTPRLLPDEVQDHLIVAINEAGDCFSQYTYLLERAASLPEMDEAAKSHAKLVKGCQSEVWMESRFEDGLMEYRATSDTLIVKGILALLMDIFSHQPPSAVVATPVRFLQETDLADTLESTRLSGVSAMVREIHEQAQMHIG